MDAAHGPIRTALNLLHDARQLPRASIDLMFQSAADALPFYRDITRNFYREATLRHWKMPLFRRYEFFAISDIREGADAYFSRIESSARRNVRKARRLGYLCRRIRISEHAEEIPEILASSSVRQGPMPDELLQKDPDEFKDPPPSRCRTHDYPYFGVFKDGHLVAYAACLIAGELGEIEIIYGHADYQRDGVTPLMLVTICEYIEANYPTVHYYSYGGFLVPAQACNVSRRNSISSHTGSHGAWADPAMTTARNLGRRNLPGCNSVCAVHISTTFGP